MDMTPLENWISAKTGISGRIDPGKLQTYQLQKLRETLKLVREKSKFYKERLKDIDPETIHSMADVAGLPFTYPTDIAANGTDFLCVSPRDIERIVTLTTSGTTGSPKRVYFTEADQECIIDFFHHGMTTFTDPSDRVMIFMPGSTPGSVGDLLSKGLGRFGCQSVVYGPIKDYHHALNALISEKITVLVGIPSQILTLSRSPGARELQLKSVLLSADYVPKSATDSISNVWNAKVYGHYGMTETGLGGGVECQVRQGYHLREADLLFEIIDPSTGLPVPDGEYGEIVFSTLTRQGMPLVRYRTGDRSRFLTAPCPCGSVLRRLDHVTGRFSEAVTLPGGRPLSITQLDEVILADPGIQAFKAELTTQDGIDVLTITVKCDGGSVNHSVLAYQLEPLLGQLLVRGQLRLQIHTGTIDFFTTGTSKRCIIDNR